MINLLPEQEKHSILKEYRLRIFVVCMFFCCAIAAIALILLFPSYVISTYQKQVANDRIANSKSSTNTEHKALLNKMTDIKQTLAALDTKDSSSVPTDLIARIVQDKGLNNKITGISYSASDTVTMTITGLAKTRESLVSFVDALKVERGVTGVDLPISSLAKDSNLSFSIVMHLKNN